MVSFTQWDMKALEIAMDAVKESTRLSEKQKEMTLQNLKHIKVNMRQHQEEQKREMEDFAKQYGFDDRGGFV